MLPWNCLAVYGLLCTVLLVTAPVAFVTASTMQDADRMTFDGASVHVDGVRAAWGRYDDNINTTGWAVLEVYTNSSLAPLTQARAAGYYEGAQTHQRIWEVGQSWSTLFPPRASNCMSC